MYNKTKSTGAPNEFDKMKSELQLISKEYNTDYHEFEFKYLKVFEEDNHKKYLLLNDKKINYDQYMKSISSSHSNDWIDSQFLYSYKN
jgi:hypothetical protein